MIAPETSLFTVLDFCEWRAAKTLQLTPKFQRRTVWKNPAKAYLIDSILKGMPIPPIYLRLTQNEEGTRVIREVVDGQQRLSAVFEFMDDQFPLPKSFDPPYAGKRYSQIDVELQSKLKSYSFICEILKGASDEEVLEVFARVNTYSIPLNDQELRNGRFFGPFRQSAVSLAHEYLEFWRRNKVFSETAIARMSEVELVSELMILAIAGIQDKKKTIDEFYNQFDQEFPRRKTVEKQVRSVLDELQRSLGEVLPDSEFSRVPLFYSLFAAIFHREFGLVKEGSSPKKPPTPEETSRLRDTIVELSDALVADREKRPILPSLVKFVKASLRQTDNIGPRRERFTTIYSKVFR